MRSACRGWATLLVIACCVAPARAEKLSKAEIARKGKAATVIVQTHPATVAGTAFGVHASGYFVTAESVVAGKPADAEVTLVLNPGLETQKIARARVIRSDRDLGLALLRVEGAKDLPRLLLGSADQLTELAELVVLGFPRSMRLAEKDPEYPSVVVDVGTVTSVSKKNGEPSTIGLKGGPTPTTSGGPLLADNGAIVGVVLISIRGEIRAVPINRLTQFLSVPDIEFVAPALTRANQHRPAVFEARVGSVISPTKPLSVDLVLRVGTEPERRLAMAFSDGVYRISTIPVPPDEERRLEVTAQFETGTVTGLVADREIAVGTRKLRLRASSRLEAKPRLLAILADGKTIVGAISGLEKVEFLVGGQPVTLDLNRATVVQVVAPGVIAAVDCTLVARQGTKEVGRSQTRMLVRNIDLIEPADLTGLTIVPPKLAADTVIKKLPDTASDIRVGGGGRYLVLHLPKLKKLAIFDVNEAAITHYIPLAEDKVVYAAGMDKVVVGLSKQGVVERWDLRTGKKELSRNLPGAVDIYGVLLGAASRGPVVVNDAFLDLRTLLPLPIKATDNTPPPYSPVSADGTVFGAWKPNQSPAESTTFVLQGTELKRYNEGGQGHVVPGWDGRAVYTAGGVRTNQLKGMRGSPVKPAYCIPAVEGDFYLALTSAERGKGGTATPYLLGNDQPLVKDVGFTHDIRFDGWDRNFFGPWKRIFFLPKAKLVVVFPESNDSLVLHRFDVFAAIEKSGRDYLLVTSRPPMTARRGAEFSYPVTVKSSKNDVTYKVSAGPEGMTVSPTGGLKWKVPADAKETAVEVILTLSDAAGQEVFHSFILRLIDG